MNGSGVLLRDNDRDYLFPPRERTQQEMAVCKQWRGLLRNQTGQHLDFGLPSLQNSEK
jgi:hypothetical protein